MSSIGFSNYGEWNDGDGQLGEDISIPGQDGLDITEVAPATTFVETPQAGMSNSEVVLILGGIAGLVYWWNNSK